MFKLVAPTVQDLKEAAKRERIKQIDEERKPRIFNARRRLIGIDTEALEHQVMEKKALQEVKNAEEEAYRSKMLHDIKLANDLENQVIMNKKLMEIEINNFRKIYQKKENSREFDLNDPNVLKKSLPCRLGDDDPRLTISSIQKFEGEESCSGEKKREKVEQQKYWLFQQMAEKRQSEQEKALAERILMESCVARDKRVQLFDRMEEECKRKLAHSIASYNKALAIEQANARKMQELRDLEDKQVEIINNITSDFLTENNEVAKSNLGQNKMIGSLYKGMSEDEKEEIRKYQEKQREELKEKRQEEIEKEKKWHEFNTRLAKKINMEDEKFEKQEKEKAKKIMEENLRLRTEQIARREYLDKFVYTNSASSDFYKQFNKSSR